MQIAGRIALALQTFAEYRNVREKKPRWVEIIVSLLGQSLPANHEQTNVVAVDTQCGEVSTREIIVIVPALLKLRRF